MTRALWPLSPLFPFAVSAGWDRIRKARSEWRSVREFENTRRALQRAVRGT